MDTLIQFIFDITFQKLGQFIRWGWFLGKKSFSELEDSYWNFILSVGVFISIFSLVSTL